MSARVVHDSPRTLRGAVFDFGGVMTMPLFRPDVSQWDPEVISVVAHFVNEAREVYHLPTGMHDLHLLETGRMTEDEFFTRMCERYTAAGNPPVDPRRAQEMVFGRELEVCAAMVDAVRQIRAAGLRTALLTNVSREGDRLWQTMIPYEELFDAVVSSAQIGMRKPDPAIYRLVAERIGLAPDECLFVDDIPTNVEGAAAVGMEAVYCRDPVEVADQVCRRLLGRGMAEEPDDAAPAAGRR